MKTVSDPKPVANRVDPLAPIEGVKGFGRAGSSTGRPARQTFRSEPFRGRLKANAPSLDALLSGAERRAPTADSKDAEAILNIAILAREDFGRSRLEIGCALLTIKRLELWKGRADTFNSYLASELKLNSAAARQYMTIAEAFLTNKEGQWVDVSNETINILACASMRALEKAAALWNKADQVAILGILDTLSEADACEELDAMRAQLIDPNWAPVPANLDPRVRRVLAGFHGLPPDLRAAIFSELAPGKSK